MPRLLQNRLGVNSKRYVLWDTFYHVVFGLQQHLLWHWSNCWGLVCLQVELLQESDGMNILEWTGWEVNVCKWESETRKAGMEHPSPVGTFNCILLLPVWLDCCHHCWVTENDLEHVMVHVWIHGCMWFQVFLVDHSHVLFLLDSKLLGMPYTITTLPCGGIGFCFMDFDRIWLIMWRMTTILVMMRTTL